MEKVKVNQSQRTELMRNNSFSKDKSTKIKIELTWSKTKSIKNQLKTKDQMELMKRKVSLVTIMKIKRR